MVRSDQTPPLTSKLLYHSLIDTESVILTSSHLICFHVVMVFVGVLSNDLRYSNHENSDFDPNRFTFFFFRKCEKEITP